MFLSDPVTIWFRRKSVDSVVSPTKIHPSISVTGDGDENDNVVLSPSPSNSACSSRSNSPCPSPSATRSPKQKRIRSWRKKSSKAGRALGRSASSCADSSYAVKRDSPQYLPPPQIFINGDFPHRLERSLSNTVEFKSSREFFSRLNCASPKAEQESDRCFDFESIPDKLRALQDEFRPGRDGKKRLSSSDRKHSKEETPKQHSYRVDLQSLPSGLQYSSSLSNDEGKSPDFIAPGHKSK
ncbi:hypothetical protein Bpfe_013743 [Biomphalaria pfeifferi]|uniref:Uncharacterized protein n=1 Tax=Biomphalaria pfeifferi TaxID=112525 RepID=A0AAD8BND6_BIOPF|nr:hypothetical protein Bpfe_013743 [Biomphalaria pfeifferi]